jgi:DNA-binding IclR family transcriptional regulator
MRNRLVDSATVVGSDATPPRGPAPSDRETSIRRSLEVLLSLGTAEAVASGGLGVTKIADTLGREKSQISRTLKTLADYGLVDRDPDTLAYRLGWRMYALASVAGEHRLLDLAEPVLERLVASFGERAFLSVRQGAESMTILSESAPHTMQSVGWVGRTAPVYCTSVGQALLFDHDGPAVERLLGETEFQQLAPNTATSVADFAGRLERAVARGYALADEELEEGLAAVAAPVRDARGRVVAAVNISGPKFRLGDRLDEVGRALVEACAALGAELAGAPPAAA